jgi:hypothetical protein
MTQNGWGFETDAAPSSQTLATLVGVNSNQPNNFMPTAQLVLPVPQEESSTSVVNNNVVNNSPSKSKLTIISYVYQPFNITPLAPSLF